MSLVAKVLLALGFLVGLKAGNDIDNTLINEKYGIHENGFKKLEVYEDGVVNEERFPYWHKADSVYGIESRMTDSWCEMASGIPY